MYQEIVNTMPKTVPNQPTETELVPLKKGQSIENALFDVEDDVQNKKLRMLQSQASSGQYRSLKACK